MSEDKAKTLQFIRDYKNHQVLWDSRHKDYNNKKKRIVALTDLGIKYNMNLRFIKNKIKSLRSYFSKEYQKVARKTEGERYRSSWFAYKHLLFLLNASPKKLRIDEQVENSDESCDDDGEELETEVVLDEDKLNSILQPVTNSETIHQARHELRDNEAFNLYKPLDDSYKDEYGLFGEFIAHKLRKLRPRNRILAQQRISDVLFTLEMEEVNEEVIDEDDVLSNSSKQKDGSEIEVKVSLSSPFQNDIATQPKSPTYEN